MKLKSLDMRISIQQQLDGNMGGPVSFVAVHQVASKDTKNFVAAWEAEGPFLIKQPGFISRELVHGRGGSTLFVDYMKFATAEQFKAALIHPDHQPLIQAFDPLDGESRVNLFDAL